MGVFGFDPDPDFDPDFDISRGWTRMDADILGFYIVSIRLNLGQKKQAPEDFPQVPVLIPIING